MTREECLEYLKNCPYDAMGDYSILLEEDRVRNKGTEEIPLAETLINEQK